MPSTVMLRIPASEGGSTKTKKAYEGFCFYGRVSLNIGSYVVCSKVIAKRYSSLSLQGVSQGLKTELNARVGYMKC